jgi:predicted nucleic acid-binding protein
LAKEIKLIKKNKKKYDKIAKNGFKLSKKYTYILRAKKFLDLKWK